MELNNNSHTMATEVIISPQEDLDIRLGVDKNSDSAQNRESIGDSPVEEPPQLFSVEDSDDSDGVVEVFHFPSPCTDPASTGEGGHDKNGRQGPEVEASSTGVSDISSAKEDKVSFEGQEWPPAPLLNPGLGMEKDDRISVHMREEGLRDIRVLGEKAEPPLPAHESISVQEECRSEQTRGTPQPNSISAADTHRITDKPAHGRRLRKAHSFDVEDAPNKEESKRRSETTPGTDGRRGVGEDQRVDSKPLDFSTARQQWARLDSTSSRPPKPSFSRNSSRGQITEPSLTARSLSPQQQQEEGPPQHGTISQERQQGELLLHRLCLLQQRQEVQQVFDSSPPLATVALEPANEGADCYGSGSVVKEWAGRVSEGEGEEGAAGRTSGEGEQSLAGLHTGEEGKEKQREKGAENEQRGEATVKEERKGKASPPAHQKDSRVARMEVENGEDNQSDSGVSADFSPGSTMELYSAPLTSEEHITPPSPPNETPIEREIRRTMEREQSLRRSRGVTKTQEFVEIPLRKPILSQSLPSKSGKGAGNDRQFAGKKMQREISMETQREQVLVQLGKVPGFYDKGTVRQLREKKQMFEAFQESKETPRSSPSQSKRSSSSASDISTLGVQGDGSVTGSLRERRSSLELLTQNQNPTPSTPCGPTLSEGTASQVIILENNHVLRAPLPNPDRPLRACHSTGSLSEGHRVTVVDSGSMFPSLEPRAEDKGRQEEQEQSVVPKENPFFKLRSSMSMRPEVEQDIREAQERERELRRQRNSLYGGTGAGGGQSPSTEIRSPTPPPPRNNPSPDPPSRASPSTPSATGRQSLRKLDLTWPPPQTDTEATEQTEAPIHQRPPRQKIPLLQRWESGMVNGHHEDED